MLVSDTDGLCLYACWDCVGFWLVAVFAHSLWFWCLFSLACRPLSMLFLACSGFFLSSLHLGLTFLIRWWYSTAFLWQGWVRDDFWLFPGSWDRCGYIDWATYETWFFVSSLPWNLWGLLVFCLISWLKGWRATHHILKASRELGNISMKFLGSLSVESPLSAGDCVTSSTDAQPTALKVGFASAIDLRSSVTSLFSIWHLLLVRGSPPSCSTAIFLHLTTEAFFSRLQNRGGQNLAGCGNFSTACSFYCTACSFYFTADARSDSENLQKFLKKWLFWTYLVPIILKPI